MTEKSPIPAPTTGKMDPKIHPVIIYPFVHPTDSSDLEELYRLVGELSANRDLYAQPITVMDRKTHFASEWNKQYAEFRTNVIARHSRLIDAWCVDTCQMWYTGLGAAYEHGGAGDVYWLIPGDFNYGSPLGREVLNKIEGLPQSVLTNGEDICIGEVMMDVNGSKQLIDTYSTFAFLYNWFPQEAQEIRKATNRPRSEFFAIRHSFLKEALQSRWYAYEQTLVLLLEAVANKKCIRRLSLGDISDLPQGQDSLEAAMAQVERTERVLKKLWREWNHPSSNWEREYFELAQGSNRIRYAAINILARLLR
jgi:hypothetical protein